VIICFFLFKLPELKQLCLKYKVKKLSVFGSVLTNEFKENSDIDFLVTFDESRLELLDYADNFFDFMDALENLFGRKIDLVEEKAMKNPYFIKEVEDTKQILYAAA
jgi:predicted nucleotidyltransferase